MCQQFVLQQSMSSRSCASWQCHWSSPPVCWTCTTTDQTCPLRPASVPWSMDVWHRYYVSDVGNNQGVGTRTMSISAVILLTINVQELPCSKLSMERDEKLSYRSIYVHIWWKKPNRTKTLQSAILTRASGRILPEFLKDYHSLFSQYPSPFFQWRSSSNCHSKPLFV